MKKFLLIFWILIAGMMAASVVQVGSDRDGWFLAWVLFAAMSVVPAAVISLISLSSPERSFKTYIRWFAVAGSITVFMVTLIFLLGAFALITIHM
jgi:hypothetical protein